MAIAEHIYRQRLLIEAHFEATVSEMTLYRLSDIGKMEISGY